VHVPQPADATSDGDSVAEARGWGANLRRGREIIRELTASSPERLDKVPFSAYRGERVALVGRAVLTTLAHASDFGTEGGFYVRVVNLECKDLRPHGIMWEVMVCGKILQVLPKNKIIVIEVDEKDWQDVSSF
jgi:hypothetical protein